MLQSIIVYSLLAGAMLLFAVQTANKSNLYSTPSGVEVKRSFWQFEIIFSMVLFVVIFGMRYDVGADHLNYLEGYLQHEYISKGEPLFDLLSDIGWKLNLHYAVYFGIIAFIQLFFFFYAFKEERYLYPFLIFFLFTNGEWLSWMNIIRQSLAIYIWIFSLKYIEEKKLWRYLIWCIVAFLFHNSALVLIIFYPILRSGRDYFKSISLQLILLASAFVFKALFSNIILSLEPIIQSYANVIGGGVYSGYNIQTLRESFLESEGTGVVYIFRILLSIIIIFYSKRLKSFYNSKRFNIIYFFFLLGIISFYMFPVGAISFLRPFKYLFTFQSIMYAYFLYYLYKTRLRNTTYGKTRALMYYGVIVIFLGIFYLSLITTNEDTSSWYQFFFDQNFNGYPN